MEPNDASMTWSEFNDQDSEPRVGAIEGPQRESTAGTNSEWPIGGLLPLMGRLMGRLSSKSNLNI
jgi:hypothetical protein